MAGSLQYYQQCKDLSVQDLRLRIHELETILAALKQKVAEAEPQVPDYSECQTISRADRQAKVPRASLALGDYKRYGRQMIMPEVGLSGEPGLPKYFTTLSSYPVPGQLALRSARVLIVGLGGLGSPAAAYLAGAGIGTVGLVDGDRVELSNLHRQIIHNENSKDKWKVDSAAQFLQLLNKEVNIVKHHHHLTTENALETLRAYDVVLDCTDRPATRYLVSDAAVIAGIPLVHGSALKTDGQLMVFDNRKLRAGSRNGRPCYRCLFPKSPQAQHVMTCGEGGILGPVVGAIGVLMATETLRILLPSQKAALNQTDQTSVRGTDFLIYSAFRSPPFRSIKMPRARRDCISCSEAATITSESFQSYDYNAFCGVACPVTILKSEARIAPKSHADSSKNPGLAPVLVDVREPTQFLMCSLKDSINLPYSDIQRDPATSFRRLDQLLEEASPQVDSKTIRFICRFGNDSQHAVHEFEQFQGNNPDLTYTCAGDIRGGLKAWRKQVDPDFPDY